VGRTNPARGYFTSERKGIVTKTAAYTATANDRTILVDATAAAVAITLPTAAAAFANGVGQILTIKKIDASVNAATAGTADGGTVSLALQYAAVTVQSNGTLWYIIGKV
jgi:hypothetical protein